LTGSVLIWISAAIEGWPGLCYPVVVGVLGVEPSASWM